MLHAARALSDARCFGSLSRGAVGASFFPAETLVDRMGNLVEKKKINVKIPPNETFIQGCYENAARDLFKDPYIFQEEVNEYDRDIKLMDRFKDAIFITVKNMVPVQEILKTNIGTRDDPDSIGFEAGGGLSEDEEEEEPM